MNDSSFGYLFSRNCITHLMTNLKAKQTLNESPLEHVFGTVASIVVVVVTKP